jgi:hypothetical protein
MKESPDPLLLRDAIKSLGNALRAEQKCSYANTSQSTGLDAFIDDWLCDYPGVAQYPPLTVVVNALRGYDALSMHTRQQRGEAGLRALLALYNATTTAVDGDSPTQAPAPKSERVRPPQPAPPPAAMVRPAPPAPTAKTPAKPKKTTTVPTSGTPVTSVSSSSAQARARYSSVCRSLSPRPINSLRCRPSPRAAAALTITHRCSRFLTVMGIGTALMTASTNC